MPTLDKMEIPRPENWQDFERIVECYAAIRWSGCNVVMCGSSGQNQRGVDIYIRDANKDFIGIQCKRVTRLPFKSIEQEIEKAEGFRPVLKHFVFATTVKRSAELQEKVNILSLQRAQIGAFTVDVIFWEDIIGLLKTDKKVLEQLYPELFHTGLGEGQIIINTGRNNGSITGKVVNIYKDGKAGKQHEKRYIDGTVGSNPLQIAYVRHLIDRYKEFKKADFEDKSQMKSPIIYVAIQRETGFKWDETPSELFNDLCEYLQRRIDNTRIGRIQKKGGNKIYSTYEEFIAKRTKGKFPKE